MKFVLVALIALICSSPAQSQNLAIHLQADPNSPKVHVPNSTVPQVLVEGSYLSLETEKISGVLFSKLTYPRVAVKAGIIADCKIDFVVYKDASVGKIKSLGESCEYFTDAIKSSIESFQWMPALEEGNAVDFAVKTTIEFRLR